MSGKPLPVPPSYTARKKKRERESIRMRPELPQNRDKQAMFLGSRVLAADGREAPIGVPDGSLL